MCFYNQKTLLLSGFEYLSLGGVLLGTVFHQKLFGDGLACPTPVSLAEKTCFVGKKTHALCAKTHVLDMKDTCRVCETTTNQFLVKNYPKKHLFQGKQAEKLKSRSSKR